MTDRLAELTAGMSQDVMVTIDMDSDQDADLGDEADEALLQFRKECDALSDAIDRVHENVETIDSRYKVSMDENLEDSDRAAASQDIGRLRQQTEKTSEAIRKRLMRIARENNDFSKNSPQKTGELRVRVNTHTGLTRRFMQAMDNFEQAQEKHADAVKGALDRQMRLMNPEASEEEILDAVRRGATDSLIDSSPTFANMSLAEQVQLKNGLLDLQSRNNDIKQLEKSIVQLHQLFVDMQMLVCAQGELLNDIEYNIEETKGKTATGFHELVEAHAYQKSAFKKKLCCIVLVIAIVLAIIVPLLIKFIPRWFPQTQGILDQVGLGNGDANSTQTASPPEPPVPTTAASLPPEQPIPQKISSRQLRRAVAVPKQKRHPVGALTVGYWDVQLENRGLSQSQDKTGSTDAIRKRRMNSASRHKGVLFSQRDVHLRAVDTTKLADARRREFLSRKRHTLELIRARQRTRAARVRQEAYDVAERALLALQQIDREL